MSTANTIRMLAAYAQFAQPTLFLSAFFASPPQNFHNTEDVEIDIVRGDEDVAIVLTDLSTGYRMNEVDIFTNKKFTPPIFKEAVSIKAFDLLKREPGATPFENPGFRANTIRRIFMGLRQSENKIRRAVEEQASQVLQSGTVTLKDAAGVALYTINYSPKATHFVTPGTAWDIPGDPLGDIASLGDVIRIDGLTDPDQLLFGADAWEVFLADTAVKARLDNRRIDLGDIRRTENRGEGASFHGTIDIGHYTYEMWTYSGRYRDVATGVSTPFLTPANVVMRSSGGRMDATWGGIPNIGKELGVSGPSLLPELPDRISTGGVDLNLNAWITPDGEQLFAGVGARPLMIPTGIDTYGAIYTGV